MLQIVIIDYLEEELKIMKNKLFIKNFVVLKKLYLSGQF